jgi:hypothetical protein
MYSTQGSFLVFLFNESASWSASSPSELFIVWFSFALKTQSFRSWFCFHIQARRGEVTWRIRCIDLGPVFETNHVERTYLIVLNFPRNEHTNVPSNKTMCFLLKTATFLIIMSGEFHIYYIFSLFQNITFIFKWINQPDLSVSQIYCSSFKYT